MRTFSTLVTLPALLLFACGEDPEPVIAPITDAQASVAVANILCRTADQAKLPCIVDGAVITMGTATMQATVAVTHFQTLPGRSIGMGSTAQKLPGEAQVELKIGLLIEGEAAPGLDVDITAAESDVDLGAARAAVLEAAVQRWAVGYGLAVIDGMTSTDANPALASLGLKVPGQPLGAFTATAAYPMLGMRGGKLDPKASAGMAPAMTSMLKALEPFTEGLAPTGVHSIRVVAKLGGTGGPGPCGILPPIPAPGSDASVSIVPLEGEVQVDGKKVGDICALSETVAWPLPPAQSQLEWEQFVVLVPSSGAEPRPELEPAK